MLGDAGEHELTRSTSSCSTDFDASGLGSLKKMSLRRPKRGKKMASFAFPDEGDGSPGESMSKSRATLRPGKKDEMTTDPSALMEINAAQARQIRDLTLLLEEKDELAARRAERIVALEKELSAVSNRRSELMQSNAKRMLQARGHTAATWL